MIHSALTRSALLIVAATSLLADLPALSSGNAQVAAAAKRAVARQATKRAMAKATVSRAPRKVADKVVRRWTVSRCSARSRCPLPEKQASTFTGGSYNEVRLGSDTQLYRVYSSPEFQLGPKSARYSYWSRSPAKDTQAVINSAIPTSRNGNVATRQVSVIVPRGTTIYEGTARGLPKGPAGGGNQIVLDRVRPEWIIQK